MAYSVYLKKKVALIFIALLIFVVSGCAGIQKNDLPAPSHLPGVTRDMNRPGFWISGLSRPDEMIMTPRAIHGFNRHVEAGLGLTRTIAELPSFYDGEKLTRSLEKRLLKQRMKSLYFKDGRPADYDFYQDMARQMNFENIPVEIPIRFGVATGYAHQRTLPTPRALYSDPHDPSFDRLQNSGLDLGTSLAILHESADGRLLYVLSSLSEGWVKADQVAFCSRDQVRAFTAPDVFVVVTAARADIYLDAGLTRYHDHVRMGTVLGMGGFTDGVLQVKVPGKGADGKLLIQEGFMAGKDVSNGFLPYTPRHIISQSFTFLNAPYDWGGSNGGQDCSRFVQAVFATVGIRLPRNSSAQARVGRSLAAFDEHTDSREKLDIIRRKAGAGSTLLHLPGHIMLYLGMVDDVPHVIHALWGYGGAGDNGHEIRVTNAVRVTPLSLGAGSVKGSLLERLRGIPAVVD